MQVCRSPSKEMVWVLGLILLFHLILVIDGRLVSSATDSKDASVRGHGDVDVTFGSGGRSDKIDTNADFDNDRIVVPFDFGWKHRTGLTDWAAPDDRPPFRPDPGRHPKEAQPGYDTSTWKDVQLPHDALIANKPSLKACPRGCSGSSFIPRHVLWYRKEFFLPSNWDGTKTLWLEFDGSFRDTTVWINGEWILNHSCGYTPFQIRLDTLDSINFGAGHANTIAIFVDPDNGDLGERSHGSGWWYEGGGLYRHVRLVAANPIHMEINGLFVYSDIKFGSAGLEVPAVAIENVDGGNVKKSALWAELVVNATIVNSGGTDSELCVSLAILDPDGNQVRQVPMQSFSSASIIEAGSSDKYVQSFNITCPQLWTSSSPKLYEVDISVSDCTGTTFDTTSVHHGFRSLDFDSKHGFYINKEHYKLRGFCDHDVFGVVGMAVPDRINLFRAQASRSIGGNSRRASHNPPNPMLLEIYDRLGIVVIDENRLFGKNSDYVNNMGILVQRDRNHPSIVMWSFCNEMGCEGLHERGGPAFQKITNEYDGTRPTLANMFTFNDLLSKTIDIQGLSHESRNQLDKCHETMPTKPVIMSECCSCNTMRDEDVGCETQTDNPHKRCDQISFNARCLDVMVNASDGVDYAIGTMVWTLFDYYGEPPFAGLEVSSTYGQFDLVGFPKHAAFWFRTQWLLHADDARVDKPFKTNDTYEIQIVESWESPRTWNMTKDETTRTVHVYSNTPYIELFVNDKSYGSRTVTPMNYGTDGSYAEWIDVPWEHGTLTAIGHLSNGTVLTKTSRTTCDEAVTIQLSLDCPSPTTGTGHSLLLDGQDVALVRASIVDRTGQVVHMATNNITFTIIDGPGYIQGTGNGDPKSFASNDATWRVAYHGLVRAVIRVTSIASLTTQQRDYIHAIDKGLGLDIWDEEETTTTTATAVTATGTRYNTDTNDIVIEATSPGLQPVRLVIPTMIDKEKKESILAIAQREAGKSVNFFSSNTHNNTNSDNNRGYDKKNMMYQTSRKTRERNNNNNNNDSNWQVQY